jgi:serine/threonine protein kinase
MAITNDSIREWLNRRFPDDNCEDTPLKGTYGLIWFLNAKRQPTHPPSFAIKTVQPETLGDVRHSTDIENIMREFRIWIELPQTYNVVSAFGVEIATIVDPDSGQLMKLPLMKMPRLEGSLDDWLQDWSRWDEFDRLVAVAHALNGLQWLYQNGIEGHGDLKPSNFLYQDLRKNFLLNESENHWPSKKRPWLIKVSDLGWADAWRDYGFTKMALRQYLAPERLEGTFVRAKSDMFSMGIIAAELLGGCHPCGNLKAATKSEGSWKRWAEGGQRHLDSVQDEAVRACIGQALLPNPDDRPDALEFQEVIVDALVRRHQCDIRATMQLYRRNPDDLDRAEHALWSTSHIANLDETQQSAATKKHLNLYKSVDPKTGFEAAEIWLNYAASLLEMGDDVGDAWLKTLQEEVKKDVRDVLVHCFFHVDREEMRNVREQKTFPNYRPFERLSQFISTATELINDDGSLSAAVSGSIPYVRSAYHFARAGQARMNGKRSDVKDELAAAISSDPEEATSHYFRASWLLEELTLKRVQDTLTAEEENTVISLAAADLRQAVKLEPTWTEPRRRLEGILKNYHE